MTNYSQVLSAHDQSAPGKSAFHASAPLPGYGTFIVLWAILAIIGIYQSANFLFGPGVIESGDFAVNALDIFRSRHFQALYGNYSRWQINHPGPAFFYVYGWGEGLFLDLLHLVKSPHQAHVLTSILLQSTFIAGGLAILARFAHSRAVACIALAVAAWFFPATTNALLSIWPPNVLFGPYVLLLCSAGAVFLGSVRLLPALVLALGFLCHGHLAQPPVSIPLAAIAVLGCAYRLHSRGMNFRSIWESYRTSFAISILLIAAFLAPLLIDLTQCPECNPVRVMNYLHTKTDQLPKWRQAINYVFGFIEFDHSPELHLSNAKRIAIFSPVVCIGVVILLIQGIAFKWMSRRAEQRHVGDVIAIFRTSYYFCILATALSIFWAHHITGDLYEFNAFYIYAIIYIDIVIFISSLAVFLAGRRASRLVVLPCLIVAFLGIQHAKAWTPLSANYSYPDTPALKEALDPHGKTVVLDPSGGERWERAATSAIYLMRNHHAFYSTPNWRFMFGWHTGLTDSHLISDTSDLEVWNFNKDVWSAGDTTTQFAKSICRADAHDYPLDAQTTQTIQSLRGHCDIATLNLSDPSESGQWTVGHIALIQFRGHKTTGDVHIVLDATPYLAPTRGLVSQRVTVSINGKKLDEQTLPSPSTISFDVPPSIWNQSGVVSLVITVPDARSPLSLGQSGDSRELALLLNHLQVIYPN